MRRRRYHALLCLSLAAGAAAGEVRFSAGDTAIDALQEQLVPALDVHGTADGVVVVLHDETLDRTTDGSGPVRARTLAEVRRLDAGHHFPGARGRGIRIPTLAELVEKFPDVPLNIEVKQMDPPLEAAVLATLDRFAARERTLNPAAWRGLPDRPSSKAPPRPSW